MCANDCTQYQRAVKVRASSSKCVFATIAKGAKHLQVLNRSNEAMNAFDFGFRTNALIVTHKNKRIIRIRNGCTRKTLATERNIFLVATHVRTAITTGSARLMTPEHGIIKLKKKMLCYVCTTRR